jgi:hypothetical protein
MPRGAFCHDDLKAETAVVQEANARQTVFHANRRPAVEFAFEQPLGAALTSELQ